MSPVPPLTKTETSLFLSHLGVHLSVQTSASDVFAKCHIDERCPCFSGHFPNFPIFPGVAQIELIQSLAQFHRQRPLKFHRIERVKFSRPILPNTDVEIHLRWEHERELVWRLYRNDDVFCSGRGYVL